MCSDFSVTLKRRKGCPFEEIFRLDILLFTYFRIDLLYLGSLYLGLGGTE